MTKAIVVFSGGQDSTTCLGAAIQEHGAGNVSCISFRYGQKHAIELECAKIIAEKLGVELNVVNVDALGQLVTSALTEDGDTTQPHAYKEGLPASFVPNRNAMFLTLAHAYAQEKGATELWTGVCQTDYSGYPDCREVFIKALETALNTGYETNIEIRTPLMFLTKEETFILAEQNDVLDLVIEHSHTCYNGDHTTKHAWGYGCGECPACELRKKGYEEYVTGNGEYNV